MDQGDHDVRKTLPGVDELLFKQINRAIEDLAQAAEMIHTEAGDPAYIDPDDPDDSKKRFNKAKRVLTNLLERAWQRRALSNQIKPTVDLPRELQREIFKLQPYLFRLAERPYDIQDIDACKRLANVLEDRQAKLPGQPESWKPMICEYGVFPHQNMPLDG
ncbi:hypothetical protein BJY04DRAFT_189137 [Aspergillus karnatakaensis]|uniref:uncharacterized protein n=1 Tax=Aspergillus karnatakaensis TaxID=1810916 RepID=UPI003CCD3BDD